MGHANIGVTLNTYTSVLNKFKNEELSKVNSYYETNQFFSDSQNSKKTQKGTER